MNNNVIYVNQPTVASDMLDLADTTLRPAAQPSDASISAVMDAFVTSSSNTAGHGPLVL